MSTQTQAQTPSIGVLGGQKQTFHRLLQLFSLPIGARFNIATTQTTTAQRHLALDSFVLGFLSILGAVFPICGIPLAITSILLGIRVFNRIPPLRQVAFWGILLGCIGSVLILLSLTTTFNIFLNSYNS